MVNGLGRVIPSVSLTASISIAEGGAIFDFAGEDVEGKGTLWEEPLNDAAAETNPRRRNICNNANTMSIQRRRGIWDSLSTD